jgi:CxxC motif-containing protein
MKTKMFFSLMVAAFLSLQVVSATDKTDVSGKNETLNDVRSKLIMVLNRVTFSESGSVKILISYDNIKSGMVYKVEGSDKELVAEVKNKISNLKIQAPENFGGVYVLKVTYIDALSNPAGMVASK